MRVVIDKQRVSIRLTAPYSEERREAASQYAKEHSKIIQAARAIFEGLSQIDLYQSADYRQAESAFA